MFGGGGDGGVMGVELWDCYLNMYVMKKLDKVDFNEIKLVKFMNCVLILEFLKLFCVIDLFGNIYNKEVVVYVFLMKFMLKRLGYIKGFKDFIIVYFILIFGVNLDGENFGSKF